MGLHHQSVSATSLAKQLVCEKQMLFDAKHGPLLSKVRRVAISRGNRVHDKIYRAGHRPVSGSLDKRCFIATAVFGPDAVETNALRAFRDRVLLPRRLGRQAIRIYYKVSPPIARWLENWPYCAVVVRRLLVVVVRRL